MRISILFCTVGVVLSACSPATTIPESKFTNGQEVVCRDVVPVGSHLKERHCTTLAADSEDSARSKEILEQAQHQRAADALRQRGR